MEETSSRNSELPKIIKDYSGIASTYIEQQDFENALEALYHSRDLLTASEEQGTTIDISFWVETFHNSALCYQRYFLIRLGRLEDCVSCLEECLYLLKDKTPWEVKCHKHFLNTSKDYLEKITKSKYKCKVNIQLCAILSQLDRHESALIHAKRAMEKAQRAVVHCDEICTDHMSLHKRLLMYSKAKMHNSQYKLLESPHYIYFTNLVQFASPIIKNLVKIMTHKEHIKKSQGLSNYVAEWLTGFQIGDMMIIDYLNFNELKTRTGIDDEISTDLLLEKICFLTISSYCIGTEIRMLSSQKFSKYVLNDAKQYYKNSKLFAEFLPINSLLFSHIHSSYSKNFGDEIVEKKSIERGTKEQFHERLRKKTPTPEIEKIYKPKSVKAMKKMSPMKKPKNNCSLAKILGAQRVRKENFERGNKEKTRLDSPSVNRNEPDPETIVE